MRGVGRIRRVHAKRSPVARRTDEALRAPIARSAGHWERAPNRLDVERVDYGKIKRTVRQPKSKAKTRQKEVAFDVERQKEILKPPSKARVTAKREKVIAEREEERARMEKDFDRWLEKSKKTKGKARYEIIVGDTVKSGVVTSNLAEAEQQMKKLRRDNPFLRRMRIVKIQKGTYVTVKLEKRKAKPKEGFADSSTNPDLQQKAAAAPATPQL